MNKNRAKKIATWIIVPLMAAIFILDIATVAIGNNHCRRYTVTAETFDYSTGDDRIHFLNTANSDAILVESNGLYGLVDAGEGNSNPRRKTDYKSYEQELIDYIKKVCKKPDGTVYLDFILGTHCHYDHIGSYPALISDTEIGIGKAYFKEYNSEISKEYEYERWKNNETYNEIISSLNKRGVEVISNLTTDEFAFGDFTLQFFNTVTPETFSGKGENASSIGIKLSKGNKSAFLAADITASTGLEDVIAPLVGDVDLLKIGHHGYFGSSSRDFLRALSPEIAIVTNQLGKVYPNVKWNITMSAKVPLYATYDNDGVIATFTDNSEIILTNNIH